MTHSWKIRRIISKKILKFSRTYSILLRRSEHVIKIKIRGFQRIEKKKKNV